MNGASVAQIAAATAAEMRRTGPQPEACQLGRGPMIDWGSYLALQEAINPAASLDELNQLMARAEQEMPDDDPQWPPLAENLARRKHALMRGRPRND